MSKSLVQLIQDLHGRVSALEAKAKAAPITQVIQAEYIVPEQPKSERKMCPKCGVKPNHFFHVKTCSGTQKEEQIDASSDGPGSKHST